MEHGNAKIIIANVDARRVVASAARISTSEGTALSQYAKSGDADKDIKLIKKVLASGHKSIMEHQVFSIAFDDVSVLVEQFMIEHRLASYTVKSRRYVDYSGAGYVIPTDIEGRAREEYCGAMDGLFALYARLIEAGVPKEDARFVLPYSFRSNFYMTVNGRELVKIIGELTEGRASGIAELQRLGAQLKAQLDEIYPGMADFVNSPERYAQPARQLEVSEGECKKAHSELLNLTGMPEERLNCAMAFSGRFDDDDGDYITERNMAALVRDARPRELEFIGAQFIARNVSLACVTHFVRHRMQSVMIPDAATALKRGDYVLPASVIKSGLMAEYEAAFKNQAALARRLMDLGMPYEDLGYLALAGHVTDIMYEMNGRELLHFFKLRTCNRAQWEIRAVAREMLAQLREKCDDIFWTFGPSCLVEGKCPEGRLSCGRPVGR